MNKILRALDKRPSDILKWLWKQRKRKFNLMNKSTKSWLGKAIMLVMVGLGALIVMPTTQLLGSLLYVKVMILLGLV